MAAERKAMTAAEGHRRPRPDGKRKATVNIIGAGRLGTALGLALSARGYSITALVARRLNHARRAALLIPSGPRALTHKQLDLLPPADLLLITTPDDAIALVAAQLAAHLAALAPTRQPACTALHTSGALSSDVLSCLRDVGFNVGSMHPLVSVSDPLAGARSLREAFYCVEGDAAAVRTARTLVRDLGGHSFSISTHDKALYHAAAVMASGHVVALFDLATEMLAQCGLNPRRARAVLTPLLRSTLENLSAHEPARALTGTFARADVTTVRRHLQALRKQRPHEALAAYTLLGQRSLQLAERNGADAFALKEIALALKQITGKSC